MNFPDLPDGEWTPEQATQAMIAAAIESGSEWSGGAFLKIDHGLALAGADAEDMSEWAAHVAAASCLNLIAETEAIADDLGATPAQRAHLIAGRVGVFRARLDELMATALTRGTA